MEIFMFIIFSQIAIIALSLYIAIKNRNRILRNMSNSTNVPLNPKQCTPSYNVRKQPSVLRQNGLHAGRVKASTDNTKSVFVKPVDKISVYRPIDDDENVTLSDPLKFDLTKAIIYKEILEPKYKEF